jgi:glutathione S-transferase
MRFYHHPASGNSRRALAVAYHLGLAPEVVIVDLMSGGQRAPEHLSRNPMGRVPVLEDAGFFLWESVAISQYLADGTLLFPADRRARADITRWQAWDLAHLGRAGDVLLFENVLRGMFGLGAPDAGAVAAASGRFAQAAEVLEAHLADRETLVGDGLTVADFTVAGAWETASQAGAPTADKPHVARWFAGVSALPAWQRARG